MKICRKFKPLFDLPKAWDKIKEPNLKNRQYWEDLSKVTVVNITGGRESSKTFTATVAANDRVINYGYRELYTRYTLKSAEKSIIPAFTNRSKDLGYESFLRTTKTSVTCPSSGGYVDFSGIKTSSGDQTANLKSLENYSTFTCEELEEYPSYEDWETIELSIRSKDVQPFTVNIMNPKSKKFWAYQKFWREKGVEEGHNGIVVHEDGTATLYIHTTYLDLGEKYVARKNWVKFEAARVIYERLEEFTNEDRKQCSKQDKIAWSYYKYTVLGGWKESEDGLVYTDWKEFDTFPTEYDLRIFGLDFGFNPDPLSFVECVIKGNDIYIKQHIYKTGLLNKHYVPMIRAVLDQYSEDHYIVADIAGGKDMAELAEQGIYTMPCDKTYGGSGMNKMRGIRKMQSKNMHIHKDSEDLKDELMHYHHIEIINSKGEHKTHVVDKDDHLMDAMLYACTRY